MRFYVGVTDQDWYSQLSDLGYDEVNFWKPGSAPFKALKENDLFLFKLHAPQNYIVGGGFFVRFSTIPVSLAWQAFGKKNGVENCDEFNRRIMKYRQRNGITSGNLQIGCIILTEPFFFEQQDWIPVPEDWSKSIVQGKSYDTDTQIGLTLYRKVTEHMAVSSRIAESVDEVRYAESVTKHRLGQGAFRVAVTDAYQRRCAISGEKTLPVLQAAHIRPYAEQGPHNVTNGLLLRSDIHTLYDGGYITITPDYHIEVSSRLHDEYGNGKDYYKYHGRQLIILPENIRERPDKEFLSWHNEHIYLG